MADLTITINPPNTNTITISDGVLPHNSSHAPAGSDSLETWYAKVGDLEYVSGQIGTPAGVVFTTGDQNVSGVKNFASRPTVNGSGVMLTGETAGTGYLTGYVNKSETGLFVSSGNTGNFITSNQTGQLTGAFYPYSSNPAAYVQGAVVRPSNTGEFIDKGSSQTISGLKNFTARPTLNGTGVLTTGETGLFVSKADIDQNIAGLKTFIRGINIQEPAGGFLSFSGNSSFPTFGKILWQDGLDPQASPLSKIEFSLNSSDFPDENYISGFGALKLISQTSSIQILGANLTGNRFAIFPSGISGNNLVYNTLDQNVSGVKNFASRPTVNGTGVLLSGEVAAQDTGYLTGYTPIIDSITGIAVNGSSTKTITLYQYDGSTLTASFTDQQGTGGAGEDLYIYSGSFDAGNGNLTLNRTGDSGTVIVSLDGRYVTGSVVRPSETGSFITSGQTGNFITSSQTGVFYPTSNPSGYITGVDLSSYATTASTTGISGYIQNQVTNIDNQTGNFALKSQTGAFLTTGAGDARYYPLASNPSSYLIASDIANLASTGYVTGVSGYLQGQINTLNSQTGLFVVTGQTGQFYAASNPSGFITGVDLSPYATTIFVTGISGFQGGLISSLQSATGNLNTRLVVVEGVTGSFATGTVVRPSETGAFLTTGAADLRYSRTPYVSEVYIDAGAMLTGVSGATPATVEVSTAGIYYDAYQFDATTTGFAQFKIKLADYDLGNIRAKFDWTTSGTGGAVVWGIQGLAVGNGESLSSAWSTGVEVADTFITGTGQHLSDAITFAPTGSIQSGDMLYFRIYRSSANVADTLAVNASLLGVSLQYTGNPITAW